MSASTASRNRGLARTRRARCCASRRAARLDIHAMDGDDIELAWPARPGGALPRRCGAVGPGGRWRLGQVQQVLYAANLGDVARVLFELSNLVRCLDLTPELDDPGGDADAHRALRRVSRAEELRFDLRLQGRVVHSGLGAAPSASRTLR